LFPTIPVFVGEEEKFIFLSLALVIICHVDGAAQSRFNWRTVTDAAMEEADSLALKSQVTFHLEKFLKNDEAYKETWHYTEKLSKIVFFQVHYLISSTEFTESYYLNNDGALICMEQVQAPYLHYYVDEVIRGERYFLVDDKIVELMSFGQEKFDTRNFPDASVDCLTRFSKRFDELQKNKTELNSIHRNLP